MILSEKEPGMEMVMSPKKGRGIVTTQCFKKGDYVVEYKGELVDRETAKAREADYVQDPNVGCYMYYFQFQQLNYWYHASFA